MGGDEDHRNPTTPAVESALKLQSSHDRHMNINDYATRLVEIIRSQEILGRRKSLGSQADGSYETIESLADRLVIVHNGHYRGVGIEVLALGLWEFVFSVSMPEKFLL